MTLTRLAQEFLRGGALGLLGTTVFFSGVFAAGVALGVVLLSDNPNEAKVRALCDQQVEALLHASDPVEVTRAGIIVRQLNCGIRRRL